jgi:hypothetical protein
MAWLTKPSGRRYYYRRRKVGGRVVSEYIGSGYVADLAAQLDARDRLKQQAERERVRRDRAVQEELDEQVDEVGKQVTDLVTAVLLVSGYHTHKRQWRRFRDRND